MTPINIVLSCNIILGLELPKRYKKMCKSIKNKIFLSNYKFCETKIDTRKSV